MMLATYMSPSGPNASPVGPSRPPVSSPGVAGSFHTMLRMNAPLSDRHSSTRSLASLVTYTNAPRNTIVRGREMGAVVGVIQLDTIAPLTSEYCLTRLLKNDGTYRSP